MKKIIIFLLILVLLLPFSIANGGCIKIVDDIFVQLSSSPIVPIADKQESFLVSFGDMEGLINEEISGMLRIVKNDDVMLAKEFKTSNGILDIKHTFKEPGLYEIFLEFRAGNKTYSPEDFLIEVIEKENRQNFANGITFLVAGIVLGVLSAKLVNKRK